MVGTLAARTSGMPLGGMNGIDEATYNSMIVAAAATLGVDSSKVLAEYPAAKFASPAAALATVITDGGFICPTRRLVRNLTGHGSTAFLYHFTRPITLLGVAESFHAAEIPFVFGNELAGFVPAGQDLELSSTIQGYWTRFAAAGDPNAAGAVSWPSYEVAKDPHLVLDLEVKAAASLKKAECDFWDSL